MRTDSNGTQGERGSADTPDPTGCPHALPRGRGSAGPPAGLSGGSSQLPQGLGYRLLWLQTTALGGGVSSSMWGQPSGCCWKNDSRLRQKQSQELCTWSPTLRMTPKCRHSRFMKARRLRLGMSNHVSSSCHRWFKTQAVNKKSDVLSNHRNCIFFFFKKG